MAFFETNYSNVKETGGYGPLPQNEYEMVIGTAAFSANDNGKESLYLDLIVRNDLKAVPDLAETNGKYDNRHIFYNLWKRDLNGKYTFDPEHLQYILAGAGVPEGTRIDSPEQFENLLKGKPVLVYTKVEHSDYKGKDENVIAPWGFKPSAYPNVQHNFEKPKKENAGNSNFSSLNDTSPFNVENGTPVDISEDDLPF